MQSNYPNKRKITHINYKVIKDCRPQNLFKACEMTKKDYIANNA